MRALLLSTLLSTTLAANCIFKSFYLSSNQYFPTREIPEHQRPTARQAVLRPPRRRHRPRGPGVHSRQAGLLRLLQSRLGL